MAYFNTKEYILTPIKQNERADFFQTSEWDEKFCQICWEPFLSYKEILFHLISEKHACMYVEKNTEYI